MRRFPDWEDRLAAYLEPLREVRFGWNHADNPDEVDCCILCGDGVFAMTGDDPISEFRGTYHTEDEAKAALRTIGKGSLISTMNAKFKRVPVGHAHRGDLVMVNGNLGIAMGAVSLHVGATGGRDGLIRHNRADWSRAWSVPMLGSSNG